MAPGPHLRQPLDQAAEDTRRGLPPERGPGRSGDRHGAQPEGVGAGKAVLPLPRLRRDACAASGAEGVSRQVSRQVRRRLGCGAQGVVRAAEAARHHSAGHRACAAQSGREGVDRAHLRRKDAGAAAAGSLRRLPRSHRRADRPADRLSFAERRTRQHAVPADVGQRRQPGRRAARHGGLFPLLQRPARNPRRKPRAHRRDRHAGRASTTIPGAGRRSATRRASATSRTPTAAASAIR